MKKGEILVGSVVFIILNLVFFSILLIFVMSSATSEGSLEKIYSKQIALILDSAKPGMEIKIDLNLAYEKSQKNGIPFDNIVWIDGQRVFVKLSEKSVNSYGFFNKISAKAFPDLEEGYYIIQTW